MEKRLLDEEEHLLGCSFSQLNHNDEFMVIGYSRSVGRTILYYMFGCLSVGIVLLFGYWYPVKRLKFTHTPCALDVATSLLLIERQSENKIVANVNTTSNFLLSQSVNELTINERKLLENPILKYFEHQLLRYYFNCDFNEIQEISGLDNILTSHQIRDMSHGISSTTAKVKKVIHKLNIIDIPMKSYFVVFIQLAANPFYVFQVASCTLWYTDDYAYYATLILVMTLISLIVTTYETKQNMKKLHDMVGGSIKVQVIRDHVVQTIDSYYLVPGDVLVIPDSGIDIPCDAVLLSGRCVVNESSLTGESFPNTKTAIDDLIGPKGDTLVYSVTKHKRHTLYNGTTVLEAHKYGGDEKVLSLVIRTGFCTLKGGLIRSIIHPKPIQFAFFRDSMKFIMVFAFIAFCGSVYTIYLCVLKGTTVKEIVVRSLDLFTIAIPPALPACMSVGVMSAIRHLKHFQIFCIDPSRINLCGKIKLFVFDKTGTLTEDMLCVGGVVTAEATFHRNNQHLKDTQMIKAMSTCHGLNIIDEKSCGDPLDLSMFEFTNAQLSAVSSNDNSEEHPYMLVTPCLGSLSEEPLGIYKQYMFESTLQRMSVVTKQHNDLYRAFVKGSPEMIMSLCKIDSIPSSIHDVLHQYTHQGCRVLALATKELSKDITWLVLKKLPRNQVECQLHFLGLIIFQNDIKVETLPTIETLQEANIRCIMATGDNLLTAAIVARKVNIIKEWQQTIQVTAEDGVLKYIVLDKVTRATTVGQSRRCFDVGAYMKGLEYSLVMTGDVYCQIKKLFPELHSKVLLSTLVYARMSPDQKAVLIEDLKELGYGVGMCGDGANDCGALKAAHAGIALSDTEASVASPFTSKVIDISCVPKLISEGRAALVTSFDTFKYMALYSFIQFFGVIILYHINSRYSDFSFLYADMVLNLPLAFAMTQSKPNLKLAAMRPNGRLVHPIFITSILLLLLVQFLFQLTAFKYVQLMAWYRPPSSFKANFNKRFNFYSYENLSVMIISFFQYIWCSLACVSGRPYRLPLYTNYIYVIVLVLSTLLTVYVSIWPAAFIRNILQLVATPNYEFVFFLGAMTLGNLFISMAVEKFLIPSNIMKRLSSFVRQKKQYRNVYKHVFVELLNDSYWPPVR